MGFLRDRLKQEAKVETKKRNKEASRSSLDVLKAKGCKACPLDKADLHHPKLNATGSRRPIFYILGEANGREEDERGRQFIGDAGKRIRPVFGERWLPYCRWNNCINCRPPKNRNPTAVEIACCSGRVEEDIERTKPKVIIGTGNVPLQWMLQESGIGRWRGRLVPVRVGTHECWFYPIYHPSWLNRQGGSSDYEATFDNDLEKLFDRVQSNSLPVARKITPSKKGMEWVLGENDKDVAKVEEWLDLLRSKKFLGEDVETQNIRPYNTDSRLLTISFSSGDFTCAFPVDHPKAWGTNRRRNKVIDLLGEFLFSYEGTMIAQNLSFELEWFAFLYGVDVIRAFDWHDTMSVGFALDQRKGTHNLGMITKQWLGFNVKELSPPMNKARMVDEPLSDVLPYNCYDSKYTYLAFWPMWAELNRKGNERLRDNVYLNHHIKGTQSCVIAQMEGIVPDFKEVEKVHDILEKGVEEVGVEIVKRPEVRKFERTFGRKFSPTSDKDVHAMFKEVLKRTEGIRGNKYSADEKVLGKMDPKEVPLAPLILQNRNLNKMKSTYVDATYTLVYPDGLLHTIYKLWWTLSGRLASEDPNTQNYPRRKDKWIRKLIRALDGCRLVSLDYGQIDARNIAMYSEDEYYIKALWEGMDIHQVWTDRLIDEYPTALDNMYDRADEYDMIKDPNDESQLVKQIRDIMKNQWTFPCFYGAEVKNLVAILSQLLDVPERIIQILFDEFWDTFRGVKKWQEWLLDFYDEYHYVETMQGRKIYGPLRQNQIFNIPIQGTTAEVVLDAMNRCSEAAYPSIRRKKKVTHNRNLQPIMQIHDDLTFNIQDNDKFDYHVKKIAEIMCAVPFDWVSVPIVVEVKEGPNWAEQEDYGEFSSDRDFGIGRH